MLEQTLPSLDVAIRLTRLNRPIGIWLTLFPCWWALTLAAPPFAPLPVWLLLLAGAVLMRSAGCVINDLTDRKFDRAVARTATRPLASGEATPRQAVALLALLLLMALGVLLLLDAALIWLALLTLPMVAAYPWMKRITWWPQLFLGLTFNLGVLFAWLSQRGDIAAAPLLTYAAAMLWTLGYDTIYAHQDTMDDAQIGVKSTARRLGAVTKPFVAGCYGMTIILLAAAGMLTASGMCFYIGLALATLHAGWQLIMVRLDDPASCARAFRSNQWFGLIVLLGLIADRLAV